eukprot:GHRR01020761.1.p1 GENE.GHRR01020761.1~~GHRR01020761.1.p1  ORF type:complete len:358 (+),score=103.92 GHRR01020761.1:387-1460(+)
MLQMLMPFFTRLTCPPLTISAAACGCYSSSAWSDLLPSKIRGAIKSYGRPRYPAQPLQPGKVSSPRLVPRHIPRPDYVTSPGSLKGNGLSKMSTVQDAQGQAAMRASGHLAAQALQLAGSLIRPGITTDALDVAVHDMIVQHGAYPSPLSYRGFPKSICTSVNEVVCHGIPDSRPLQDGDIVNVDVTVFLDGYHGDTSGTFLVGQPSAAALQLVEVTRQSLKAAIELCGPGVPFWAIGRIISNMAHAAGMAIVQSFVGHGIGKVFHAEPAVLHHRNWRNDIMQLHQTFTIEPILTLGTHKTKLWPDGWTQVTQDGSLAAQFEHTVMVIESGVEVLTELPDRGVMTAASSRAVATSTE